jgi:Cu+-exporting ATPase
VASVAPTSPPADESTSTTLDVRGMTCAACQSNVERALRRQSGVREASVNLITGEARVRFDAGAVTPDGLVAAVEAVGYEASVARHGARPAEAVQSVVPRTEPAAPAVVSLALAGLSMLLSMQAMGTHGGERGPVVWVLLAASLVVMGWAGRQFYISGYRALWHGAPDMNSLVAVGTSAAFGFSLVATFWPHRLAQSGIAPDVYYEAVAVIVAFVQTGRWLESRARHRAVAALRGLAELQPRTAIVVRDGTEADRPIEDVALGDTVLVRAGGRVPLDGVVAWGRGSIDESSVTGESLPVTRAPDDRVTAGTLLVEGALHVRVRATAGTDTVSRLVELMREAQLSRAPIQELADRVSAVFVPTVLVLSVVTFVAWWAAGGAASVPRGLAAAVAVLIVACPCAMGLAVPTAVLVATGRASALGVMVKGGDVLQRMSTLRTIVLDKTGTLTEGRPAVVETAAWDAKPEDVLAMAAALERVSEHPLARAIVSRAGPQHVPAVSAFSNEAGHGVSGVIDARRVWVGQLAWLRSQPHSIVPAALDEFETRAVARGATVAGVAVERERRPAIVGAFAIADTVRASSQAAVAAMARTGLDVVMLSGDRAEAARAVAQEVGIERVIAGVSPAGKMAEIARLRSVGPVGMVGDGVNDAPALATADIGFAMGSGTDIAAHAGDITLMRSDLRLVAAAVRLARAAMRVMRQNLFWAFAYNVLAIPLAAGAFYPAWGLLLSPTVASAAMALSSVSVLANSLRLRRVDVGL